MIKQEIIPITISYKNKDYYQKISSKKLKSKDVIYVETNKLLPTSNIKIHCLCDECEEEYLISFKTYCSYRQNFGKDLCDKCRLKEKQSNLYNKILEFCNENNYQLITKKEELFNNMSLVSYICPLHGKYTTKVTSILQNKKCYHCSRETALRKKHEQTLEERQNNYYEKIIKIANEKKYQILTDKQQIQNNISYIQYLCPIHGEHKIRVANFINGKGCPECASQSISDKLKLSIESVNDEIESYGGQWINKDEYVNRGRKNLKILCPCCKSPFITSLRCFSQHKGQLCPNCRKTISLGEAKIKKYLDNNKIKYIPEKWFQDCRDKKPLPFDFYLPQYNMVIEYDGIQHFKDKGFTHSSLKEIQFHDNLKNNYCNTHGIKIIRIPYWEIENINSILNKNILINLHEDIV